MSAVMVLCLSTESVVILLIPLILKTLPPARKGVTIYVPHKTIGKIARTDSVSIHHCHGAAIQLQELPLI